MLNYRCSSQGRLPPRIRSGGYLSEVPISTHLWIAGPWRPPYYMKGRDLYYDFYVQKDHKKVAEFVTTGIENQRWIVSYDNVPEIRDLYKGARHIVYNIGYSARSASQGSEVMFFCDALKVPPLIGPIQITDDQAGIYKRMA